MSMYCCDECGVEESFFPEVIMAVNTMDGVFPYHNNLFERKFNEFSGSLADRWDSFYLWLHTSRQAKWFCSKKCAEKYLFKSKEKEE